MAPYNAAKAAVVSLSETMYSELQGANVGVTVLCPTFFQTNLLDSARATDPSMTGIAAKLMRRSNYSAGDVARVAIEDVLAGRLHSVPMTDGRWLWRLRRMMPQLFQDRVAAVTRRVAGKA
jgi:short-subunit dehydrogenase